MTVTEPEVNWLLIISTLLLPVLGLAFGVYKYWRSKGRIKIGAYIKTFEKTDKASVYGIYGVKSGQFLNIVATNVGQGPVNLLGGGLVYMTEQPDGTNEIAFPFSGNRSVLLEATRMYCHEIALDGIDLSDIRIITSVRLTFSI